MFNYVRHPVTFELYLLSTQEGSNVPLKLKCDGKPICPTKTNTQTVISLQMYDQDEFWDKMG